VPAVGEDGAPRPVLPADRSVLIHAVLTFVLVALVVIVAVHLLANRWRLPAAALLTLTGIAYSFLPGPNIGLDPELVLTFVIPPLLYSAALHSSVLALRKNLRTVLSLSVGLVLATALLIGAGIHLLVPTIGVAAAIALGAAVAPPDPVAALSIGRRAGLPAKLITLIEGEGLLNDATALTILTVAVAALEGGGFSPARAGLQFLMAAVGGLVVGIAVAALVRLLTTWVREPLMVNSISLATPFAAYLLGEQLHVSGVLAVVVAGLLIGHQAPRITSGSSRLQTNAVWRLVDFLLEGFVFLLIGQQAPAVLHGLSAYPVTTVALAAGVTLAVMLLLRPLWLLVTQLLPRRLHMRLGGTDPHDEVPLTGREALVLTWSGTRGVITLAAVFTLPLTLPDGTPLPGRNLLLFCAFLAVLVTLVGQGLTFAPVVRAAGLRADAADAARIRNQARTAAVEAALAQLDELEDDEVSHAALESLREGLHHRLERYRRRVALFDAAEDGLLPISPAYEAAVRARRAVIDAQREELLRWRDDGRLPETSLRLLERELDAEEEMLPGRSA
jgi:Na+/H+ antiporter